MIQNSHLVPWFWLMPNRSYFICASVGSLGWIALPPHSSLMKWKDSYLRRGELEEIHLPHDQTRNRSFGPQSYISSFTMGPWTFSSWSTRRSSNSLHEQEVSFWFFKKNHVHPWGLWDLSSVVLSHCKSYDHLRVSHHRWSLRWLYLALLILISMHRLVVIFVH